MIMKLSVLKLVFLYFFSLAISSVNGQSCRAIEKEPWSYTGKSNGPDKWGRSYRTCDGREQSPLNINTREVEKSNLDKLRFHNYNIPVSRADLLNNGHSVELTPRDYVRRYIEIGRQRQRFQLQVVHFHWCETEEEGTEHAIDNEKYDMEAHFVHRSDNNEVAVVGVLYEVSRKRNPAFQPIVDVLSKVYYKDDTTVLRKNLTLNNLLPSNPASFYRYRGSLTTPPCTERVIWSIVKKISRIGQDQLSEFLKLHAVPKSKSGPGCKQTTNVRPLQRVNDREILVSD